MRNIELNKVRNKIDKLDKKLLVLIKKRTDLVKKVLKNIKKNSIKKKVDPKLTVKIWNSMIKSYIEFEKRNFKRK